MRLKRRSNIYPCLFNKGIWKKEFVFVGESDKKVGLCYKLFIIIANYCTNHDCNSTVNIDHLPINRIESGDETI